MWDTEAQPTSGNICRLTLRRIQAKRDMIRYEAISGIFEPAVSHQLERHAYNKVEYQLEVEQVQPGECRQQETENI